MKKLLVVLPCLGLLATFTAANAATPSTSYKSRPVSAPTYETRPAIARSNLEPADNFYDTWIRNRLSIGLGVSYATLTDPKRPKDVEHHATFVGYVWKLEDVDQFGFFPEIRYRATQHLRLVLSMDQISGRTRNYNKPHSDGIVSLKGPQLLLEFLQPLRNETLFLHAGAGFTYGFVSFDETDWWYLGYGSEESWNEYGRTGKTHYNYYRDIRVHDAFGWTVSAGCSWRPAERWELDFALRHTWIEPDCEFGYNYGRKKGFEKHQDGDFTLDHLAVALTCSYVF